MFSWYFHNVSRILSKFEGMVKRLEAAAEYHNQQAQQHQQLAITYALKSTESKDEAARSQNAARKIKELIA